MIFKLYIGFGGIFSQEKTFCYVRNTENISNNLTFSSLSGMGRRSLFLLTGYLLMELWRKKYISVR